MDLINLQGLRLFEDSKQNCFSNKSSLNSWKYDDLINSSLTVFAKSLKSNQTYQFMIEMIHRKNASLRSIGYLTVTVEHFQSPMIMIR
jgi:hypothetical protein